MFDEVINNDLATDILIQVCSVKNGSIICSHDISTGHAYMKINGSIYESKYNGTIYMSKAFSLLVNNGLLKESMSFNDRIYTVTDDGYEVSKKLKGQ